MNNNIIELLDLKISFLNQDLQFITNENLKDYFLKKNIENNYKGEVIFNLIKELKNFQIDKDMLFSNEYNIFLNNFIEKLIINDTNFNYSDEDKKIFSNYLYFNFCLYYSSLENINLLEEIVNQCESFLNSLIIKDHELLFIIKEIQIILLTYYNILLSSPKYNTSKLFLEKIKNLIQEIKK